MSKWRFPNNSEYFWTKGIDEAAANRRTPEQIEIDRLRAELDHFTKSGIVEIAVRNPSVAEYMRHWEGRAEKAERTIEHRNRRIARLVKALDYAREQGVRFPGDDEPHVVLSTKP